jgi:hypothetical protein
MLGVWWPGRTPHQLSLITFSSAFEGMLSKSSMVSGYLGEGKRGQKSYSQSHQDVRLPLQRHGLDMSVISWKERRKQAQG